MELTSTQSDGNRHGHGDRSAIAFHDSTLCNTVEKMLLSSIVNEAAFACERVCEW